MGLRRLIVEFSTDDLSGILGESLLKIDSMETLALLRESPEEVTLIGRMRFKDASSSPKEIFGDSSIQVEVIEQEQKDTYTVLLRNRRQRPRMKPDLMNIGAYLSTPFEIGNGAMKATFLGTAMQTRKLLSVREGRDPLQDCFSWRCEGSP